MVKVSSPSKADCEGKASQLDRRDDSLNSRDEIDAKKKNEFLSYYNRSRLPPIGSWKQPIYVSPSARAPHVKYELPSTDDGYTSSFPLCGEPIAFDGPLFEGTMVCRVRGMKCSEYFKGRSRQYQWTVQGRFKRRVRFDRLVTGQDFDRPFRNPPSMKLVKRGLSLLRNRLPETFECELDNAEPRFEHPLMAGCQFFRVDKVDPSEWLSLESVCTNGEVNEDSTLLGDPKVPKDPVERRAFFSKQKNLEKFYFETDLVYTFDFFCNFFSPSKYALELTQLFTVDLIPYFNGYPLFLAMAKEKESGSYLWANELWHKRLTHFDEKPGIMARLFAKPLLGTHHGKAKRADCR